MFRPATVLPSLASLSLGAALAVGGWHAVARWEAGGRPAALLADAPAGLPGRGPVIGLLFTPEVCAGRLRMTDSLNALHRRGAAVVGWLMVDRHVFPGWQDLVRAQGIEFPVVPVSPARVRRATGALGGGRLLLLVMQGGRVSFVSETPDAPASLLYLSQLVPEGRDNP